MTVSTLYAIVGMILVCFSFFALIRDRHLLRKIIALNILGSGVFMVLIAAAARDFSAIDALPHALVLTGIVIAVSATALALVLARRIYRLSGQTHLPEENS
ncbi:sodium:proton antiporter [Thioflexithrix psekupsensis]|uniref:Na+/H+ antiporter subunit C n=1 Tax=Thioflexithrix psekupsensis TaxID=1570016 RepID=A0A251X8Y2_9GAMM|nr:NADH-quinone oxidoreductase subunit K [Thioflexithrix psekupsensis]OUD14244.1 hypothetical protein TPSD3_07910 [Thioflexithrix psekupsensis]